MQLLPMRHLFHLHIQMLSWHIGMSISCAFIAFTNLIYRINVLHAIS